jgi:exodeoxyribonuclease V beta subunit
VSRLEPLSVSLEGTQLIEASAGTGKTYTITTLYLRLLLERQLAVDQILVVTYTNAATAELRERIRSRLREALQALGDGGAADAELVALLESAERGASREGVEKRLVQALRRFDESAVFTIHGFCQRVLQENAFECGMAFDTEYVADERALFEEVSQDFWAEQLFAASPTFVRYLGGLRVAGSPPGPPLLATLARAAVSRPEMPILPERAQTLDPAAEAELEQAFLRSAENARAEFAAHGEEALALLVEAVGRKELRAGSYKPDTVLGVWPGQLEALLAHPVPGKLAGQTSFKNCTVSGLDKGTNKDQPTPQHAFFDACEALASADRGLTSFYEARWLAMQLELAGYARAEIERRKQESGRRSFDDMLLRLQDALRGEGGADLAERIRSMLPAALIDEFQDTDPVQYEIFRRIWHDEGCTLFLIGDPKQAIYAFRGADVFAYMRARADAGPAPHTLLTNYRSVPGLIGAVNEVFSAAPRPFVFEQIPFEAASPRPDAKDVLVGGRAGAAPLRLVFAERSAGPTRSLTQEWMRAHLYPWIASDIAGWLQSGSRIEERAVHAGDLAVLCRTNYQARAVQEELRALRIPSVLQNDESVFDGDEAQDVERLLRAVAEPGDVRSLRAALATGLVGEHAAALEALEERPAGWDEWLERFDDWRRCWQNEGPVRLLERVIAERGAERRLLALPGGERRLTNLLHLAELLQSAAAQGRLGPLSSAAWLQRMRLDEGARSEGVGDGSLIRLESDERAVKLVTIHRSKGLQYPIVYCHFLSDGTLLRGMDAAWTRYHDPDDEDALKLDIDSREQQPLAEREALAESLRLAYVAMTRAQYRLILVWGRFNKSETSPLAMLLHPAEEEAGADDVVKECHDRLKEMDDAAMWDDLMALQARSAGQISVEKLADEVATPLGRDASSAERLVARVPQRTISSWWRTSSFSGLVAGDRHAGAASAAGRLAESHPAARGLDFDAQEGEAEAAGHGDSLADAVQAGTEQGGMRVRLHDFPAGAQAGTMMHDVLEHLDFQSKDPAVLRSLVTGALDRHGLAHASATDLSGALEAVLATPLGPDVDGLTLGDVGRADRIDEMEFTLPVAERTSGQLTAARLAAAFRAHASSDPVRDYAERIGGLGFPPLEGYLRGFVDMIFRHRGRYYVVDYKSNRLGEWADDYAAAPLERAMADHHYTLQYHLYVVALHRHLEARLPGYAPQQHLGGVYYLFLRGMSPDHAPGTGIYSDRPPQALVDALSGCFAAAEDQAQEVAR